MPRGRRSRGAFTTVPLLMLLAVASGCALLDGEPDQEAAADRLAAQLAAGEVADAFGDQAAEEYEAIVAGLGDATPEVSVQEVGAGDDEGSAVATLRWTWPLAAGDWSYDADAALRLEGDAWQPVWEPAVVEPSLADGEALEAAEIAAERGQVLGRGGLVIVGERPVVRLGIDRTRMPDGAAARSARRLARLVGVDPAPYAARVAASGDRAFVEAIVLRQEQVPPRVAASYRSIPGARAVPGSMPLAPTREFAAPILGSVGEVTAEVMEENPGVYQVGDLVGLSGLQARYEERLRGTPGQVVEAVDSEGGARREVFRVEPQPGEPLELTLDARLQEIAELQLARVRPGSALVAVRPSTGAILVAANGPGTDGYNLATYGQLAPGSTFKIVSSLALLRAGLAPGSAVSCPPVAVVDGRPFTNYDGYPATGFGRIQLRTALALSCNTAFISERRRLGRDSLSDAAATLGLGVDHDVGFPAYFGQVPPATSETEAAASMIGQSRVLASPMAIATVMASVVAGETVVPGLVKGVERSVPDVAPLTPAQVRALRAMLRGVVTSGSGSGLADVPGPPVLAKTGTAEFQTPGGLRTHAWMVAAQGDLAVAVLVEVGESGSGTAGPILEAFLRSAR